jgi:hypothetical protein
MNDNRDEFSVVVSFRPGRTIFDSRSIGAREAVMRASALSKSVAGRTGLIQKIIITDGGDHTVFAWEFKKGITYPAPEELWKEQS